MDRSTSDPQFFTGKLWLMESGSFQVRLEVNGAQGKAQIGVPVAAFAQRTLGMQKTTGAVLALLMVLLVLSLIAILGTATRESQLEPGLAVPPEKRRRGRIVMALSAAAILGILFLGNMWWTSVANANARDMVYKPPPMQVSLSDGNRLTLKMGSSYWHELRKSEQLDKIIPDHGHLMHLFLVRRPDMDYFYHLHPEESAARTFTEALPAMAGGSYAVFADIVRESGFPDTMTAKIEVPATDKGAPLVGDDSSAVAVAPRISGGAAGTSTAQLGKDELVQWVPGAQAAGSIPMAALMLLQKEPAVRMSSMPGMRQESVPAEITFPYGFPQAGDYRLFLQVKRAGHVETAVFDTRLAP